MEFYGLFLVVVTYAVISSAQVSNDELKRFADANNNLAGRLYPRLINGNSNNVFFAPASLYTGLGVMLYGARGKTQEELYSVLGYKEAGLPLPKIPPTYHYYFTQMLPQNIRNLANYSLYCADLALVTNRAPLYSKFVEDAQNLYEATIHNIDFSTHDAARGINEYANKETDGKISHIVNNIDASSSTVLVNAAYIKGNWETPFPSSLTTLEPFFTATGGRIATFMRVTHSFPYFETPDYQAVLLPYIGGNVGMLILLPNQKNGLSDMEKDLTPSEIVNVLSQLKNRKTLVSLPKFEFQYYRNFTDDFIALGAKSAFDGSGDFSGMTHSKDLHVTSTLHKAALEVCDSNQGPNTATDIFSLDQAIVTADHPFMFAIVDRRINLIIFLGRVTNL